MKMNYLVSTNPIYIAHEGIGKAGEEVARVAALRDQRILLGRHGVCLQPRSARRDKRTARERRGELLERVEMGRLASGAQIFARDCSGCEKPTVSGEGVSVNHDRGGL